MSYRSLLWIIVCGVLLAVAQYSLAIQSAHHAPTSHPELGAEPGSAGSGSGTDDDHTRILR